MNEGILLVCAIFFFIGLTVGWFCKSGNVLIIIIVLLVCESLLRFMVQADQWFITIPFVIGFLVHTGKSLKRRLLDR